MEKFEDLMKEVEELGYSAVGRKYSVSDNAIRKWIKNNI
jgi:transposase-like protein